jgi:hypothetical protein
MANSMPWIQLLLTLVIILAINVFTLREGFNIVTNPFSQFIQSLLTIDPDHQWLGYRHRNYHNGWDHDGSGNTWDYDGSGNCPTPNPTPPPPNPIPPPSPPPNPTPPPSPPPNPTPNPTSPSSCPPLIDESAVKTFYNTMKADINEAIKNELTNEYNLNKPIVTDASSSSCGTAQGKEMLDKNQKDCPQNVKPFDMSEYIRKDSIPCWGCSM